MDAIITQESPLKKYGASLSINRDFAVKDSPIAIDCETDEQDNLVGLALTQNGTNIWYYCGDDLQGNFSSLKVLNKLPLIGHNLKGDAKWLKSWGWNIQSSNLFSDTMLQSYVISSTKESHSLKDLASEYLKMKWNTYKEMVHPDVLHPKKKITLDKQDVNRVAEYCAMDCLATYRLYYYFTKIMTPFQKRVFNTIEMPLMQLLYEMEVQGINIDTNHLKFLDEIYKKEIKDNIVDLELYTKGITNLNSPKQLKPFIEELTGHTIPNTNHFTLESLKNCAFVNLLLSYKRKNKLYSTYIKPYVGLNKLYTTYNQVTKNIKGEEKGISTGRLSSNKPNLQNIPAHGEDGKGIRKLFIPEKGKKLITADYSQIEYRLLAHFSKEPRLMEAYKNGDDIHQQTAMALGLTDRHIGKTLNFAAIYGAGAKKIALASKVDEKKAQEFLDQYWKVLPRVKAWINRTKFQAKAQKGVYTLMKRWIPLLDINSSDPIKRWHWERAAVSYIIQGSAAEIIKLAMIKLKENNIFPILQVHDELLFEEELNDSNTVKVYTDRVKYYMESIVKLDVPLIVNIGYGKNWEESKNETIK